MADAAQDFLDSGGQASHPLAAANDSAIASDPAQSYLDTGGSTPHPLTKTDKSDHKSPTLWDRYKGFQESQLAGLTGGVASLAGGLSYLGDRALLGRSDETAQANKSKVESDLTYSPRTEEGKRQTEEMSDAAAYLGAKPGHYLGSHAADMVTSLGGSPELAGAAGATGEVVGNLPQYVLPAVVGKLRATAKPGLPAPIETPATASRTTPRTPVTLDAQGRVIQDTKALPAPAQEPLSASGADRPAYFEINDPKATQELGVQPEKQEAQTKPNGGELPIEQQQTRKDLAARVGIKEVRTSAITGDAQAAADDFDSTKYTDDPMGDRMRTVMKGEKQALTDHASGIIDDLGAKEGTDQSTLIAKGKTMVKPLDDLQDHIDKATTEAYEAAKEKGGTEPIQFPTLQKALTDKTLTNSLLAQGKEGFLKGVNSQWNDFNANNPGAPGTNAGGINAGVAEQYRQFLNTLWKTNPDAVGTLKNALDTDMHAHFGENIFGEARQLHQMGKVLLENPKGVQQIAGKDPNTPANRTTPHEDIPDKVANLDGDQFKNLINTYKMMPDDLQPQAQAAIKEIQGHMVNRLLDAGAKHETQWNKKGVNTELANNSENFKTAFADNPQASAKIKDLKDAGEMLRFNSGYRGAHAQASNMEKSGVGKAAAGAGGAIGAGIGSYAMGPGLGTVAGAAAGKAMVGKGLGALDSRAIKKAVEARVTKLP